MNWQKYDRLVGIFDPLEKLAENWSSFGKIRQKYISPLKGKILEIGVGSGANLKHYDPQAEVVAIEPSPKMLARAEKKLTKLKHQHIKLKLGRAEELQFSDNSFDYVVSSLVFCSVDDPQKAISEVKRVLKPDGKAIFIEHVASQDKTINFILKILNPFQKVVVGCDLQRNTKDLFHQSGLKLLKEENLKLKDVFRYFEAQK